MFDPITTYRLQFHSGFTFADFENALPYLKKLGINTVYASPVFKAIAGSTHGYDILDPLEINEEIGTLEQFRTLRKKLKEDNIQWVQDIVPNHMAYHTENMWLSDVFENGQKSSYVHFFDIDWNHPAYPNQLMVPFFGESPDMLVDNGNIKIEYKNNQLVILSNGSVYPIRSSSYFLVLKKQASDQQVKALLHEIAGIDLEENPDTYNSLWTEWKNKFNTLAQDHDIHSWLMEAIEQVNNNKALLKQLLNDQHYCFCNWQDTNKVINYRRFFTVNALISLNMQNASVFQHHHQLVKSLLDEDLIQGLRVDHVDGLYDPGEYFRQLRAMAGSNTYIAIEKILEPGEKLENSWPIQGTTGYEFLAMVSNLLTSQKNKIEFSKFYNELVNDNTKVPGQVREKKTYILYEMMAGDLDNLYRLFIELELIDKERLDSLEEGILKKAIGAFLIYCPVYRFYGASLPLDPTEADEVKAMITLIKTREPYLSEAIDLIDDVLFEKIKTGNDDYNERAAHFYERCMQFTGPLMAKGVEDTLMYSFNRFILHNEVGDAPDAFGYSTDTFHQKMKERLQYWPLSLNASSTHDTKRGEDARARLTALTELPGDWFNHIETWRQLNKDLKENNEPDANDEYFIYQTLVSTYPMPGFDEDNYASRLEAYLEKALREAKSHSEWAAPNDGYESAAKQFALSLLDKKRPFWRSFSQFHESLADYGVINSLVQVMLKFTCPGVPDTYQGCELWDFSFVDPDNRRAVDFDRHQGLLDSVDTGDKNLIDKLWETRFDGRVKLWLVQTLMRMRSQDPELFSHGAYIPLTVDGEYKEHVLAFARKLGQTWLIVAVPLNVAALSREQGKPVKDLDWKDTRITMPKELKGKCEGVINEFKAKSVSSLPVQKLFTDIPLSILKIDTSKSARGAGILLHITSLPSAFGVGDLGPEAYSFADLLYRTGQKYWQVLPLNPIEGGQGYSPYSSTSSHAGNTYLVSPELLVKDGFLAADELPSYYLPATDLADYDRAGKLKDDLLTKAWIVFNRFATPSLKKAYNEFTRQEDDWLHDFALYTVLKNKYGGKPWYEWDEEHKFRNRKVLKILYSSESEEIDRIKWMQFIFDRQLHSLKEYCNNRHIELIGDIPFYVSYDSADVWANREIFALNANGDKTGVAGVPPDLFSNDGQLWGMPVFDWEVLKKNNYSWWISRLKKNKQMFDIIRLDHFRAFADFWEVPANETTARNGQWKPGPGADFFRKVKKQLGTLPFLAEDLGEIDEQVYQLRDEFNFPGMKVLQFGFGNDFPFSDHLPQNYTRSFFAYTGTHDNNTTKGWFRTEADNETRDNLNHYAGQAVTENDIQYVLPRLAYSSVATTVIIPIQDLLGLDENARMNKPATTSHNWGWRLLPGQIDETVAATLRHWMNIYNRG